MDRLSSGLLQLDVEPAEAEGIPREMLEMYG